MSDQTCTDKYPVVIYELPNYLGKCTSVDYDGNTDIGSFIGYLGSMIIHHAFVNVTLYTETDFKGKSQTWNGPIIIPDLGTQGMDKFRGGWTNRAKSIQVQRSPVNAGQVLNCCTPSDPTKWSIKECGRYKPGGSICSVDMKRYCMGTDMYGNVVDTPHMDNSVCQIWCKSDKTGVCDVAAKTYCDGAGKGTPFCKCLNSEVLTKYAINPTCADRGCLGEGYILSGWRDYACPPITDCSIKVDLTNRGFELASTVINQTCGTGAPTDTASSSGTSPYIYVGIALLFVVIAVIYYVLSNNTRAPKPSMGRRSLVSRTN